jgi:hypothetical protein
MERGVIKMSFFKKLFGAKPKIQLDHLSEEEWNKINRSAIHEWLLNTNKSFRVFNWEYSFSFNLAKKKAYRHIDWEGSIPNLRLEIENTNDMHLFRPIGVSGYIYLLPESEIRDYHQSNNQLISGWVDVKDEFPYTIGVNLYIDEKNLEDIMRLMPVRRPNNAFLSVKTKFLPLEEREEIPALPGGAEPCPCHLFYHVENFEIVVSGGENMETVDKKREILEVSHLIVSKDFLPPDV